MSYTGRLSVAPGSGRLVRADNHCLFVPDREADDSRVVASLVRAVLQPDSDEQTVTDFVLGRPCDTPPFAWISWAESSTTADDIRLILRGEAAISSDLGSLPTLSGEGSPTWVEHRVRYRPPTATISSGTSVSPLTDLGTGSVAAGGFRLVLERSDPDEVAPAPRVPVIPGRRCAAGHPNPPHLVRCRICDASIDPGSDTVTVRSPVLALARFEDGRAVELAGTKAIGRRPRRDSAGGAVVDDLVAIDAPSSVSRTHLVIAASGWSLTITDCGTRSGTVLIDSQRPDPVPLEPWIPHELGVGDIVRLGGATTMTIVEPTD